MNMPGFTAETSLYKSAGRYLMALSSATQTNGVVVVPQQLDPNKLTCAALCAICAGTLVAPELIVPEIACAMCVRLCTAGQG